MNRMLYWSIMAAAALMAGALLAAPVWDYYHYGQSTAAGIPVSPTTLAVMTGGPVTLPSYPSAEPVTRPATPGETVLVPIAVSSSGSGPRKRDGQAPVPAPAPNTLGQRNAPPPVRPAMVSSPAAGRPATDESPTRIEASPTRQGVVPASGASAAEPRENPQPVVNQAASVGWVAGNFAPRSPSMPAPDPPATDANHDHSGQQGRFQPSESTATATASPDVAPLRLTLAPDRHAVSRGETFSVEVVLTGGRDITSVPFHLQFDPAVLQYVGARTGPALNGRSLQPIFLASVNPGRPGDLAVGLSFVRSSGTFNGSGAILLIDFQALAPGRSDLLFDRASVRGSASETLPAEIVGSSAEVR